MRRVTSSSMAGLPGRRVSGLRAVSALFLLRMRLILALSSRTSKGLVTKSSAPSSMVFTLASTSATPLRIMTGMSRVSGASRMLLQRV